MSADNDVVVWLHTTEVTGVRGLRCWGFDARHALARGKLAGSLRVAIGVGDCDMCAVILLPVCNSCRIRAWCRHDVMGAIAGWRSSIVQMLVPAYLDLENSALSMKTGIYFNLAGKGTMCTGSCVLS